MTFGGSGRERYQAIGGLALSQAKALVDVALDAGVNFFDTADVYARGESETLLGEALGTRRRDVILATRRTPGWVPVRTRLASRASI